MLTAKQKELLLFIHNRVRATGIPPSYDEMKDALDLRSKSGIHRLITALEERGFIRRLPHRARALEVLKVPDTPMGLRAVPDRTFPTAVARGPFRNTTGFEEPGRPDVLQVPVMGRIAAGVPRAAIEHQSHVLTLPLDYFAGAELFALEVKGDSMIDAGIHDGDTVILRKTEIADNGDIVVALIDEEEATLKRFRRRGQSVALEAANPAYETRIFGPDRVRVQGKLAGLLRRY